jgi:tetratricopeptide (TPR) repeat protein
VLVTVMLRISSRLLLIVAIICSAPAALADDGRPLSGAFHPRTTPCLLAKYRGGQVCDPPSISEAAGTKEQVAARIARAHFFVDMQQLPLAVAEADAALKLDADNADVRHLVARLALTTGDFTRAEREVNEALTRRFYDLNIRATRAEYLETNGAPDDAVREHSLVLLFDPRNRFSRTSRAKIYLRYGEFRAAIRDLDALLIEHLDPNFLVMRASALLALNEPAKAIDDYSASLEIDPGRLHILMKRANAFLSLSNDEAALRDLDTILGPVGGKPNYAIGGAELAKMRFQRANILRRLKRHADAATDAMTAVSGEGVPAVLRAQTFLRRNGFPEMPLDGKESDSLKAALRACFGINSCFDKLSETL